MFVHFLKSQLVVLVEAPKSNSILQNVIVWYGTSFIFATDFTFANNVANLYDYFQVVLNQIEYL